VFEDYNYEAGMDPDAKPIMAVFSAEDREDFMEE
jgi:hypothetical protein